MYNVMVMKGGKINCLDFNSRVIAVAGTGLEEAGVVTLLSLEDGTLVQHLATGHTGQVNNFLLTDKL